MIATGFNSLADDQVGNSPFQRSQPTSKKIQDVQQESLLPELEAETKEQDEALVGVAGARDEEILPLSRFPDQVVSSNQLLELDIPTFIRRQMD